MNAFYVSTRIPAPHDEVSKECKEDFLANIKNILTLILFREFNRARQYYDRCGGPEYFKMNFHHLGKRSIFGVTRNDDGEFDLVDRTTGNISIMDSHGVFQRIEEALIELRRAHRGREEFTIAEVKVEMKRQGWTFYPKSVDRAFFEIRVPDAV